MREQPLVISGTPGGAAPKLNLKVLQPDRLAVLTFGVESRHRCDASSATQSETPPLTAPDYIQMACPLLLVLPALNNAKEIEEFPVTGPKSRFTAAVQPPRAIHTGLRLTF